jgi:hypothetical protein
MEAVPCRPYSMDGDRDTGDQTDSERGRKVIDPLTRRAYIRFGSYSYPSDLCLKRRARVRRTQSPIIVVRLRDPARGCVPGAARKGRIVMGRPNGSAVWLIDPDPPTAEWRIAGGE